MKKLFALSLVLFAVFTASAGQLSLSQSAGPYEWEFIDTIADTIRVTGTASDTLFKDIGITHGCGYAVLIRDSLVNDSAAIKVNTFVTKNGTQYGYAVADNISSADATYPYVCVDIPIGFSTAGSYMDIYVTGLTATVKKTIYKAALYRYRKREITVPRPELYQP